MDFESPDVEKEFPGLYASEAAKKCQSHDSDYSDEEKSSRKDLLGKRKEKRESKKDKGYVAFEGESSGDDVDETRSPGKGKKNKSAFKFSKKDKHVKVKEKENKEKKEDKEKVSKKENKEGKKDKNSEKRKEKIETKKILKEYKLIKLKDKKKKNTDQEVADEKPIFGVPLQVAVERSKSHDGIDIPVVVRECIDYIEEHGLACEGVYRISGVKSKLRQLKLQYNKGEKVYLYEHEPHIIASLLKQFLRDLPEPILTSELTPKFEEAAAMKNELKKADTLEYLLRELPRCNYLLLSWIFVHMLHVVKLEKRNKMNLQNVSIVLSPTMQISHRVLHALFAHSGRLFRGVEIKKYVPPIELDSSRLSLELPDSPSAIEEELNKQENVLNKLHAELNTGLRDKQKEEQLWEIQRIVTQLKRKFRFLRQVQSASKPTPDENDAKSSDKPDDALASAVTQQSTEPVPSSSTTNSVKDQVEEGQNISETSEDVFPKESEDQNLEATTTVKEEQTVPLEQTLDVNEIDYEKNQANKTDIAEEERHPEAPPNDPITTENKPQEHVSVENEPTVNPPDVNDFCKKPEDESVLLSLVHEVLMLQIQRDELMLLGDELRRKVNSEKLEIGRLHLEIKEYQQLYKYKQYSFDSTENSSTESDDSSASDDDEEEHEDEDLSTILDGLMKENKLLEKKNSDLSKEIQREREICLNIKVQMKMLQTEGKNARS